MKMKNLIKLICMLVIIIAVSLWAFGANVSLFGKKFISWDEAMLKGNDLGKSVMLVYNIVAPKDSQGFDVHKEAINAVDVINKRADILSIKGLSARVEGLDNVAVNIPLSEYTANAYGTNIASVFSCNGKITVSDSSKKVLFTEKDIEGASLIGYEQTSTSSIVYHVDVNFTDEAEAKLNEVTSNGAYSLTFALDTDVATATLTGSEAIKNGKVSLEFTSGAEIFELCANSGAIDGTVALQVNSVISGTAGENAICVISLVALVMLVVAALYFILSNKALGVAAIISSFVGFIVYVFFAATFNWLGFDISAVAGMVVGVLFIVFAHMYVNFNIARQYLRGKDLISALDNGVQDAKAVVFELSLVAAVIGIGLWIIGAGFASFGIAVMGGAIIAALSSIYVLKYFAKIFVGLGASAKSFGLKRGE